MSAESRTKTRPRDTFYTRYGKRLIDIAVSIIALLVTSPINLLIAVGTLLDVGRPVLFKQERLGKDGKVFTLVKFRNMTNETDEHGSLLPAGERVTKFGRLMRKTSLDELLNFWPILKGDMSLIGPRPLLVEYGPLYSERHRMRMAVRPGLECPTPERLDHPITWQEQFDNDVWYVENVSLATDLKLLLRIVDLVFDRRQTAIRGGGSRGVFGGYDENGVATSVDVLSGKTEYGIRNQENRSAHSDLSAAELTFEGDAIR